MSSNNSSEIDPFFKVNVEEEEQSLVKPIDMKSSWKDLLKTSFANVVSSDSIRSKNNGPAVQDVQIISEPLDGLIDDDNDIYSNLGLNLEKKFKINEEDDHIVKAIDAASKFLDKSMEELQTVDSYDQDEDEDVDHFDENSINNGSIVKTKSKRGQWSGGDRLSTNKLSMMLGDVQGRLSNHAIESEPTEPDSPPKVTYLSKEAKDLESLLFLGSEPSPQVRAAMSKLQQLRNSTPMTSDSPQPSSTAPNTEVKSIRKGGRITRPDSDDASVTSTISASSTNSRSRLNTRPPSTSDKSRLTAENIKLNNASAPPRTHSFSTPPPTERGRSTTAPSSSAARPRSLTPNSYTGTSRRTVSASPGPATRSRTPTGTSSRPTNSTNYFIEMPAPRKAPTPTFSRVPSAGTNTASAPKPSTAVTPVKPRSTTPTSTLRSSTGSLNSTAGSRSTTPNRTSASTSAGSGAGAGRSTTPTGVSRVMAPTASSSNRSTTPTLPRTNSSMSNRATTPNGSSLRPTTPTSTSRTTPGRSTTPTLTGRSASSSNLTANRSTTPTLTSRSASSNAMLPNTSSSTTVRTSRSTTPTNVGRSSLTSASPARSTTPNALYRSATSLGSSGGRSTTPNSLNRHSSNPSMSTPNRSTTPTGLSRPSSASTLTASKTVATPTAVRPGAVTSTTPTGGRLSLSTSSSSPVTRTGSSSSLKPSSSSASTTPVKPPLSKSSPKTAISSNSSVSSAGSATKRSPSSAVGLTASTPPPKAAIPKFSPVLGKSSTGLPPVSPASKLTNVASPVAGSKKIPLNATLVNPNDSIKGTTPYMSPGMSRSNTEPEPEVEAQSAGGVPVGLIAVMGNVYMPSLTHSSSSAIAAIYYSMDHSSAGHSHASLASNSKDSHDTL